MSKNKFTDEQVRVYGVLQKVGRIEQPHHSTKSTEEMERDRLHMNHVARSNPDFAPMSRPQLNEGEREVGALNELARMGIVERTEITKPTSGPCTAERTVYTIKK